MKSRKLLMINILLVLSCLETNNLFSGSLPSHVSTEVSECPEAVSNTYKFEVGDKVSCSKWKNGSYWIGKVIERKDGLYKVKISKVRVEGFVALRLNANPCTGNKRLSYEDGAEYNSTEIWVLEVCLD